MLYFAEKLIQKLPIFRNINASGQDLIQIHIPRTGGTYTTSKLQQYGKDEVRKIPHLHDVKQHYTLLQIQSYHEIKIDDTFIFTTIRNPIYRTLSTYRFFCRVHDNQFLDMVEYLGLIEDMVVQKKYNNPAIVNDYVYNKKMDINHFRPQVEYIASEDLQVTTFRLEYDLESLKSTFETNFGIDLNELEYRDSRFDQLNSDHIEKLVKLYRSDFEFFGYDSLVNF